MATRFERERIHFSNVITSKLMNDSFKFPKHIHSFFTQFIVHGDTYDCSTSIADNVTDIETRLING